ncbi:hypothetical protein COLO4_27670 [Corchorus olitorius]|uniref:Uncharacterized protein n=1 Tax=Corchorus olitorius TaxID=93759 RepID=A0A1R3HPK5_9ROSI|nr:hypothetical protein COLO4_27670 [Corchorus olitorius]
MAEAIHLVSRNINQKIPTSFPSNLNSYKLQSHNVNNIRFKSAASKKQEQYSSLNNKKDSRSNRRRLITISTADGRWPGTWSCDYLLSLRDLNLDDLLEDDEQKDAQVSINLCIHKHASFGLSVDGRIVTSFNRKCSICSSPYCRQVIYVKPGYEANLDSLIQDTIRLTLSTKDTCSESCQKSEPTLRYIGKKNAASIDKRWSRLLELRKAKLQDVNF